MAFINPDQEYLIKFWNHLYVEMLSNPDDHRTDVQFCKDVDISRDTLWKWKCKYRLAIYHEVQKRRNQYIQNFRNILQRALAKKVESGDTNAIKLGFQIIGDLVEKSEHRFDGMQKTDKEKRIEALLTQLKSKQEGWARAEDSAKDLPNVNSERNGPIPGDGTTQAGS